MNEEGPSGEPSRAVGPFSAFAIQFAVFAVPGAILGDFTWGLKNTTSGFLWAWVLGGGLQLCVALSLCELSSAFPLPGGCYTWLRRQSHPTTAWFVGFLLLFGYIAAVGDVDISLADSVFTLVGVGNVSNGEITLLALALLAGQTGIVAAGIRVAARGLLVAVIGQLLALGVTIAALLVVGLHTNVRFLLDTHGSIAHEHMPPFILMLMIPAWTLTGLDISANLAGEMREPSRTAPCGLMSGAIAAYLGGIALILVPLLAMTNVSAASRSTSSLLSILTTRLGSGFSRLFEVVALAGLFFLPVALQLASAQLLQAQARDRAWPGSTWISAVGVRTARFRPILVCAASTTFLCLIWPFLYGLGAAWPALWPLAYAVTIAVGLQAKRRDALPEDRAWRLGNWSQGVYTISILWCLFLACLLPLFDVVRAVPAFAVIALFGLLVSVLWIRRRAAPPGSNGTTLPA
jgi:amino acid transporter